MKDIKLHLAKESLFKNLLHLKNEIDDCVNEGMIDEDYHYYNEVLALMDQAEVLTSWNEVEEAVELAKTLETDVNTWLARQGQTSLSMEWPQRAT